MECLQVSQHADKHCDQGTAMAIVKEGRHVSRSSEAASHHQLRDREVATAKRNARAAAKLAATLQQSYEDLLSARSGIETKPRR